MLSQIKMRIIKSVSIVYLIILYFSWIWHLWNNVCTNYIKSKDKLSDVYYAMDKTYIQDNFNDLMLKVDVIDHK